MVKVTVPASSANLGPGFDCLGLALGCYVTLYAAPKAEGFEITGCPVAYRNEDNLAVRAFQAAQQHLGSTGGARLHIVSDIPVASGLGSSAALLVAGLVAACALHGRDVPKLELLQLATALEGHPDNVAPALLGGLQAGVMADNQVYCVANALHPAWRFVALIPPFELSTKQTRAALPASVSRADAVFNLSRVALLLGAFKQGDGELLRAAMQDKLHQPHRFPLIPDGNAVQELALAQGADACCISGAGPTLLAVGHAGFEPALERVMAAQHPTWRVLSLCVDMQGARVQPHPFPNGT